MSRLAWVVGGLGALAVIVAMPALAEVPEFDVKACAACHNHAPGADFSGEEEEEHEERDFEEHEEEEERGKGEKGEGEAEDEENDD